MESNEIEYQDIIFDKEDNGIVNITLNKPERKNAMSQLTFWELWQAFDKMEKDKSARVVILTGAGDAFSSGGYFNPKIIETFPPEIRKQIDLADIAQKKLCLKLWGFEKPIIAAINGLAIGAGITMCLTCCDLIYMSETAYAQFLFVKRAILPEFACTYILPYVIGFQRTKELIYFGEQVSPEKLLEMGLINKICSPDELLPYAKEQALKLVPPKGPSLSLKWMKKALHEPLTDFISKALDMENKGLNKTATSKDFSESMKALKEKRDPVFDGK